MYACDFDLVLLLLDIFAYFHCSKSIYRTSIDFMLTCIAWILFRRVTFAMFVVVVIVLCVYCCVFFILFPSAVLSRNLLGCFCCVAFVHFCSSTMRFLSLFTFMLPLTPWYAFDRIAVIFRRQKMCRSRCFMVYQWNFVVNF